MTYIHLLESGLGPRNITIACTHEVHLLENYSPHTLVLLFISAVTNGNTAFFVYNVSGLTDDHMVGAWLHVDNPRHVFRLVISLPTPQLLPDTPEIPPNVTTTGQMGEFKPVMSLRVKSDVQVSEGGRAICEDGDCDLCLTELQLEELIHYLSLWL